MRNALHAAVGIWLQYSHADVIG